MSSLMKVDVAAIEAVAVALKSVFPPAVVKDGKALATQEGRDDLLFRAGQRSVVEYLEAALAAAQQETKDVRFARRSVPFRGNPSPNRAD